MRSRGAICRGTTPSCSASGRTRRRDDLRANNSRLLEYVQNGGTVIVQYNRAMIDDAYGPYPAQISNNRVTDERAPGADPRAGASGVHHAEQADGRGVERLGAGARPELPRREGFALSRSRAAGRFVPEQSRDEARARSSRRRYGKGRWIYIALGLWRELPAGVDGAYPILANLISLGQPPPADRRRVPTQAPAGRTGEARRTGKAAGHNRPHSRRSPPAPTAPR